MAVESLNARTLANIVAGSTNPQEMAWLVNIHRNARGHMPMKSWFGTLGGGKPIMEVLDTKSIKGQEVVASVRAALGQRGTGIGESRADKSEQYKSTDYKFKIGQRHHSVSQEKVAANMTLIGSKFDQIAAPDLAEWHSVRQCNDIEAELFARMHERNTLRPNNKASTNDLNSADTFGLNSVVDIKEGMLGIGASPLRVSKGPNAEQVSHYYIQGSQFLFADLNRDSNWSTIRQNVENRGSSNSVLAGGKPMYDGCILNEWELKINDYNATQGARLMPFAQLGLAIAANTATDGTDTSILSYKYIYGGGSASAAINTEVDYFQNFKAAPYEGYEGVKIAATTGVEYYVAVKSTSGANKGKVRLFAYQVNDGNKITITRALSSTSPGGTSTKFTALSASGSPATWNTGDWVASQYLTEAELPIGSLVYQCNIKGQCLCYGYGIGENMLLAGYGSSDGAGSSFGNRTSENQDFGRLVGIGVELVWGCRAVQDTNNMVNGYVVYEAAYNPPGFPEITA